MPVTRRGFIGSISALGLLSVASLPTTANQHTSQTFDPADHGFGFRNWSSRDQHFQPADTPSETAIQDTVTNDWRSQMRNTLGIDSNIAPRPLIETIALQLRLALVQRAGTNGHCYGMALTAQHYYEHPDSIPVERALASEIDDPTFPIEEPETPVYDEIVDRQANQYLNFRSWLGRRAMLYPDWINTPQIISDIKAVIDAFGTATLTVFDRDFYGHQVLAYDVIETTTSLQFPVYDPNRHASTYRGSSLPTIHFDNTNEAYDMQPYDRYTGLLFNQYDQIERATKRRNITPFDHLTVDQSTIRSTLFPIALILVESADVELVVVDPDGTELPRMRGTHMDKSRGRYDRIRSLYGADPGEYQIAILANYDTEYRLATIVTDLDGAIIDAEHSRTIEGGDVHEYTLDIPENGEGSLTQTSTIRPEFSGVLGAIGGAAAGAIGHRTIQHYHTN